MNKIILLLTLVTIVFSCKKSDPEPLKNSEKKILSFAFTQSAVNVTVDSVDNSIFAVVPLGTDFTKLVPSISISEKATISPASGSVQDFTKPVTYTVTAEDGSTKIYTVTIAHFVDIVGEWKVNFYINSKLQPSLFSYYLRFFADKTFSYNLKTMQSSTNSVQVYWGAYDYLIQTNQQFRQRSKQNATMMDNSKLTEKEAPFVINFIDGSIITQYKDPTTGNPRGTYGNPFVAKANDPNSVTLTLPDKDNLLELKLSREN